MSAWKLVGVNWKCLDCLVLSYQRDNWKCWHLTLKLTPIISSVHVED